MARARLVDAALFMVQAAEATERDREQARIKGLGEEVDGARVAPEGLAHGAALLLEQAEVRREHAEEAQVARGRGGDHEVRDGTLVALDVVVLDP